MSIINNKMFIKLINFKINKIHSKVYMKDFFNNFKMIEIIKNKFKKTL